MSVFHSNPCFLYLVIGGVVVKALMLFILDRLGGLGGV